MPAAEAIHGSIAEGLAVTLREAGAIALGTFGAPLRSWTKHDASPVSEADIAVNHFLHARLKALAPDCAWLSEETADAGARLSASRLWIVDPIDGTRAYLEGRADWSISVALVQDGRPAIAALFAPVNDLLYEATRGGGARLNGAPLRLGAHGEIAGLRVAGPKRALERLQKALPAMQPAPKVHSLALRLARVASGELDVAIAGAASHDWDLAAADLLVHEAGGTLTSLQGNRPSYNLDPPRHRPLVAAGALRHRRLIEIMRQELPELA